jgi:hypothetical protein
MPNEIALEALNVRVADTPIHHCKYSTVVDR